MKLGKRINLVVVFLITIIMTFTLFIAIPIQKEHLKLANRKIIDLMDFFITRDNSGIANAIFENRINAINQRMSNIREIPDVLSASVYNTEYKVISTLDENPPADVHTEYFIQAAEKGHINWIKSGSLWYLHSISLYDEVMGFILINYSLDDMNIKEIRNSVTIIMLYLILTVVLLLIINIFVLRTVITPVNRIIKSMENISDEKYGEQIEVFSNNEIGDLASKFNEMSQRVYTSYNSVNSIRNMLENIIDSMDSVIFAIDNKGLITAFNTASEEFTEVKRIDAVGHNFLDVFKYLEKYNDSFNRIFVDKKPIVINRVTIEKKIYDISIFPLTSEDSIGAVIRLDDISENEKREEQLRQAQKMETIGNLAGGLAHDFNNVLTGIVGTASLMKMKTEDDIYTTDEMIADIDVLESSAERASGLVKKLLTISRKYKLEIKTFNLNKSVKNVINICKNTFDKKIRITTEYLPGKPVIKGDENQIEQVLLNICINALHAMTIMRKDKDFGGELKVSLRIAPDDEIKDKVNEISVEKYYLIMISDNGIGMSQDIIESIFDPFFTTKSNAVGSGLGLSMVYNMIKKHDGFIDVESAEGVGTEFKIYLPAVPDNQLSDKSAESNVLDRGSGNILVIDDEEIVRSMISKMLELSGYTVYCASGGMEGIDMLEKMSDIIDLVILDMVMPEISGDEVFSIIKDKYKNVKVLLSSGFSHDERVKNVINDGVDGFISKPYQIRELTAAVSKLINKVL